MVLILKEGEWYSPQPHHCGYYVVLYLHYLRLIVTPWNFSSFLIRLFIFVPYPSGL